MFHDVEQDIVGVGVDEALSYQERIDHYLASIAYRVVLASFDLKSSHKITSFFVFHDECRVYVALDAVCVSVELLFCSNEFTEAKLVLVFVRQKYLIKPCCDILDCLI